MVLQEIPRERSMSTNVTLNDTHTHLAGYKVGRVDQAETALGAEMRMAADKSQGKISKDKNKEKIVRRQEIGQIETVTFSDPAILVNSTKFTRMVPSSTPSS